MPSQGGPTRPLDLPSLDSEVKEGDLEKDGGTDDHRATQSDLVTWDGSNDPANPLNWSRFKRVIHVVYASAFALFV